MGVEGEQHVGRHPDLLVGVVLVQGLLVAPPY
jgi:hypothetical protein